MSKLDVGVGDEFPLEQGDENRGDHGHRHGFHGHRHWHHHGRPDHDHPHAGHRYRHHFHGLPLLLILAGVGALIVAGKIPVMIAYAMIGLGLLAVLAMAFFGVRHFRRHHRQPQ